VIDALEACLEDAADISHMGYRHFTVNTPTPIDLYRGSVELGTATIDYPDGCHPNEDTNDVP